MQGGRKQNTDRKPAQGGVKRFFSVDPGWDLDSFPKDAVCYQSPDQIREIFQSVVGKKQTRRRLIPEADRWSLPRCRDRAQFYGTRLQDAAAHL